MDRIEKRLESLAMAKPSDALRMRLMRSADRERPSEWKRLQHTMEWCAATLIAVYGWSLWFENGSEQIRQGLRTTAYAEQQARVEEQVAEALADAADEPLREYVVAQRMAAYARPFVVETEGISVPRLEVN